MELTKIFITLLWHGVIWIHLVIGNVSILALDVNLTGYPLCFIDFFSNTQTFPNIHHVYNHWIFPTNEKQMELNKRQINKRISTFL